MIKNKPNLKQYNAIATQLKDDYTPYKTLHQDVSDYIAPFLGSWNLTDKNKQAFYKQIRNNYATMCLKTLVAGLHSHITPKNLPWFVLTTLEALDINNPEDKTKQEILDRQTEIIQEVILSSNIYDTLYSFFLEYCTFGIGCFGIYENTDKTIYTESYTIGQYYIGCDDQNKPNKFLREFRLTIQEAVNKFGYENLSESAQEAYDKHNFKYDINIYHLITPELDDKHNATGKYSNIYWEHGLSEDNNTKDKNHLLKQDVPFNEFPIVCARWFVKSNEIYSSTSPAIDSMENVVLLNKLEQDIFKAMEFGINPAYKTSPETKMGFEQSKIKPGSLIATDFNDSQAGIEPLFVPDPTWYQLGLQKQAEIQEKIRRTMFNHLFSAVSGVQKKERMTTQEVINIKSEAMTEINPMLQSVDKEALDVIITRIHAICKRQNKFENDNEINNFKPKYISVMHEVQKSITLAPIERSLFFIQQLAQIDPNIITVLNTDNMVKKYLDNVGLPANMMKDEDEINQIRNEQKAEQDALLRSQLQNGQQPK
jgi:hypothetical protein